VIRPCTAEHTGYVVGMNARDVGIAVVALGGGRAHADDAIDPAVGLTDVVAVGTAIRAGSPLCMVHAASEADAEAAIAAVRRAIWIGDAALHERPVLLERVVQ
jgi:thymidine phosphorylase